MALSVTPVGQAPSPEPEAPKIYSEAYKHSIVESVYQNETPMLSMVPGTPVLTEYHRQVQKNNEELHAFQPGSRAYQSHTRIKDLIIKFAGEDFNFDMQTAVAEKTGSGYVIFGLVPLVGDFFIADIGDGNAGWFTVLSVSIPEFTANKVYKIEWKFEGILTKPVWDEMESQIVEELVYSRDQHLNGGTPLISTGEFDLKKKIASWYPTIVHYVYEKFYWEEERTLAFMVDGKHYYDPYLVKAFLAMARGDSLGTYPRLSTLTMEYSGNVRSQHGVYNVWDVIFRNDWNTLRRCKNTAGIVDVRKLYSTRTYNSIRSSAFDGVVVTNPEDFADMSGWYSWMEIIPTYNPLPTQNITYLFSEGFYQGKPEGVFENLIVDVLKHDIVDLKRIHDFLETYWDLTLQQQLYYAPILLLMIFKSRKMGKVI